MMSGKLLRFTCLFLCCWTLSAQAHKPSDSYLSIRVADGQTISGQWDIALRDLDFAIGLDSDGDGSLTWDEIRAHHGDIAAYAMSRLHLGARGESCKTQVHQHMIDEHSDGAYAVIRFSATCPSSFDAVKLDYSLLFDLDQQHKGLLRMENAGQISTAILTPDSPSQVIALVPRSKFQQFFDYLSAGVWHIWIGFDHILFLLSLLLPAVLSKSGRTWLPGEKFVDAFVDVAKIVTAFTLAHSITLSLAVLTIVSLPSRWVESAIAASVVIAAMNNLFPSLLKSRWIAAFFFGLIHGFGFASVLSDLGLPPAILWLALIGFNLGVELGQLAIVSLFLPLAYALRRSFFYRQVILGGGSALVILIASVWFVERAFNLRLI